MIQSRSVESKCTRASEGVWPVPGTINACIAARGPSKVHRLSLVQLVAVDKNNAGGGLDWRQHIAIYILMM